MIYTVKKLINNLNSENGKLKQEVKELKQKLQFRHTEINDLRYTKKLLLRQINEKQFRNDKLSNG